MLVGYNELTFTSSLRFLDASLYFQTVNNIAFCSLTIPTHRSLSVSVNRP